MIFNSIEFGIFLPIVFMKKNLIKILFFCFYTVLIIVFPFVVIHFIINSRDNFYKVPEKVQVLIVRNSQIECSLNDRLISDSVSIASSADDYFHSFLKVRKFTEENKNINKIVLGYSNKYLLKPIEQWYNGDATHLNFDGANVMSLKLEEILNPNIL